MVGYSCQQLYSVVSQVDSKKIILNFYLMIAMVSGHQDKLKSSSLRSFYIKENQVFEDFFRHEIS